MASRARLLATLVLALSSISPLLLAPPSALAQETPPPPPAAPEDVDLLAVLRGEGRGITSEDAARRAVQTAPSIEAARASVDQARAGALRAWQAFFPRLELSARYTRLSPITQPTLFDSGGALTQEQIDGARALIAGVDDPEAQALFDANLMGQIAQAEQLGDFSFPVILDQFVFGAALTIPVSDMFFTILPAYEASERAVDASRFSTRARASEVAQQAREAYYQYARARGALAVAQSAVAQAELQERLVSATVAAGAAASVDLVRVQAAVAAARVAVLRAQAGVAVAQVALRTVLHVDDSEEISIAEDILALPPPVTESRSVLIERALDERAEVQAIAMLIRARSYQIEAAEGSRLPHLAIAGNFQVANPNPRIFPQRQEFSEVWDLSVVLSWAPNDFFTGERQADEARAQRAGAEADLRTLEDGVRLQVTQAFESYQASRAAIEAAQLGVSAADENIRVRNEQYRAGTAVLSDLVQASNERIQAQLNLVGAAIDAHVAYTQLQRAIGADGPYDGVE